MNERSALTGQAYPESLGRASLSNLQRVLVVATVAFAVAATVLDFVYGKNGLCSVVRVQR